MATDTFTNANGTLLTTHNSKWKLAGGITESAVIQSNAAEINAATVSSIHRFEDAQPQQHASEGFFEPGDWADGIREVWCNGTDANDSYKIRVSATWWSLYKDATILAGRFQIAHGLANIATLGLTARVEQEAAGLIRVSLAVGDTTPTSIYTTTDGTPKTGGYPGFRIDKGASARDQYRIGRWTDGIGTGGGGGGAPTLTDVDTDETVLVGQASVAVTGTALTGGTFQLRDGALTQAIAATINSATSATLTSIVQGEIRYGLRTLRVTTSGGSADLPITLAPASGKSFVNLSTPNPNATNRITAVGDLVAGDQLEISNVVGGTIADVTVNPDASFNCLAAVTSFDVRVHDGTGWGSIGTQTVQAPGVNAPAITTQPSPQTVLRGASATFSVVATGTAPLGYQWLKNGTPISGATSSSYTTPATVDADNGALFAVQISNASGSVTSSAVALTVNVAPAITAQPVNVSVPAGQVATFSVVATGRPAPTYQWRKNGVDIPGATGATYTTPVLALPDSGALFDVVLSNSSGNVTSQAAVLTVTAVSAPVQPPLPGAGGTVERVSKVGIANLALTKLGALPIESFTEDSKGARVMTLLFDRIRDAELARRWWNFAKARRQLAEVINDEPRGPFRYAYALPADWLSTIYVGNLPSALSLADFREYDPGAWSHEGLYILTNEAPPADLHYIRRITDPTRYHVLFVEALACRLAMEAADALTASLARWEKCAAEYKMAVAEARRMNAIQNPPQTLQDSEWIASRY